MPAPDVSPRAGSETVIPDVVVFGAGYVGGAVCREGRRRGLSVLALTRNPERATELRAEGIAAIEADLADSTWHARVPVGVPRVLNSVSSGGGGMAGYVHSYEDGLRSILAWAGSGGGRGSLVYTSSTSVYPQGDGVRVDEATPTEASGDAAAILLRAEALAARWPGPRAILRLAGIYGPGRHSVLDQLRAGERLLSGAGRHRMNLIHRDDAAAAVWSVWDAPAAAETRVYNVADGAPAPKEEMVAWLAARLGVPAPSFSGEAGPGRRRLVPDRWIVADRIRAELGWRPGFPSYREGYAALLGA